MNIPIYDIKQLVEHLYDVDHDIYLTTGDEDEIVALNAAVKRVADWLGEQP